MKAQIGPENLLIYSENLYEKSNDITDLRTLGEFNKKILFLVNEADFGEANEALFHKICAAVSLNEADYKLVVLPLNANPLSIINDLKPNKLICFETGGITLNKILNKTVLINDIQLLSTHSIKLISTNQDAKKSFWGALKKLID